MLEEVKSFLKRPKPEPKGADEDLYCSFQGGRIMAGGSNGVAYVNLSNGSVEVKGID